MKLYFMIGLPTETDEDVRGIVETGARAAKVGRGVAPGKRAEVTVSVSTHVPKPHTPFQWAAMDGLDEVARKQRLLKDTVKPHRAVTLKTHDADASVLEGVFARGDRPLADVIERAWKNGARFDSWDDQLELDVWREAFAHHEVDPALYLGTIPVTARLPWDHIDVGLEDGFLAREYRRALQDRLSPPCGKVAGTFVHHTNVEDAVEDQRRLVCYDCGVACDMTQMRAERIEFLEKLGSHRRLPVVAEPVEREAAVAAPPVEGQKRASPARAASFRYRFRFTKTGPMALLGHLDVVRELPRVLRRAGVEMAYTAGFHPKPDMTFGPALSLGVMSLDEYADVRLAARLDDAELRDLVARMSANAPAGMTFLGATRLEAEDPPLGRVVAGARYLVALARSAFDAVDADAELAARCRAALAAPTLPIRRELGGLAKMIDVKDYLLAAAPAGPVAMEAVARAGLAGDLVAIDARVAIRGSGSVKPSELAVVLAGSEGAAPPHRTIRYELFGLAGDAPYSPLDLSRARPARIDVAPAV
jgi:radical SAM-linked protein